MKVPVFRSLTLAVMMIAPAIAADMPVKAPPIRVDLPYNWSGFYIGGGVGGAWTEANRFMPDLPIVGIPPTTFTAHATDLI
jgi:outer membrane immunogenic protein